MQSLKRQSKGLPLLKPTRVVKARFKVLRIFMSALLGIIFVSTSFVSIHPVQAIETTKASALVLEEMRGGHSLSFTKKSPPSSQSDPCHTLLKRLSYSPVAKQQGVFSLSESQHPAGGKVAAPVALGLFLGVRLALGPKEAVQKSKRVQIGPEFRAVSNNGDNRALAIAAYRSCKNNHDLTQYKNNNNKQRRSF